MVSRQAPRGRDAQRRRTRREIVAATQRLLSRGNGHPTVAEVAAEAEVSRRTVYVHFPTLDQLVLDAALGALSESYVGTALVPPEEAGSAGGEADEVRRRVDALVTSLAELGDQTLPLGRQIIRLTVAEGEPARRARGARRTAWLEEAVAPVAGVLTPEEVERLISALSLVIGFEAMVVLRDVRGLDRAAEAEVTRWAARALADAALADLSPTR